jgi:hypothetical protein
MQGPFYIATLPAPVSIEPFCGAAGIMQISVEQTTSNKTYTCDHCKAVKPPGIVISTMWALAIAGHKITLCQQCKNELQGALNRK